MAVDLSKLGQSKSDYTTESLSSVGKVFQRYGNLFVQQTKKNAPEATNQLKQSIRFEVKIFGMTYRFTIAMEDYAIIVDEGRSPGKYPPYDPVKKTFPDLNNFGEPFGWLQAKGMRLRNNKGMSIQQEMRTLAFLVARKIKEKGVRPTNFFSRVVNEKSLTRLKQDLTKELRREVEIEIVNYGNNNKPRA